MKKIPRIIKYKTKNPKKAFKRCPMGGMCFNPMCMFGCIEHRKK